VGIILRSFDYTQSGIQRVAALTQKKVGVIKIRKTVVRRDDDGDLA
jgi:hypothetical protein